MRFYLTYKDHGLYDPVVDDTEVIYIPVDPEELGIVNIQTNINETQQKTEIIDIIQIGEPPIFVQPVEELLTEPHLGDLPLLINVDEIPVEGKFRLPISENYDPEGNRVKSDKLKGKAAVTFNVKNIINEANEERIKLQQAQDAVSEYISESKINQYQEIKEDLLERDKEADENVIRGQALVIVSESIDRAISVAKEIEENDKNAIRTSEDLSELITKKISKSFQEKSENVRKESIKNIEYDVNVAEEIKKFEKIEYQTNAQSNIEERKLLAQQEIDETIQSGTVRRTFEIYNKENIEISRPYGIEINKKYDSIHTQRDESSYNDAGAKQRAFSIGLQTIPHIRENINSSQIDYRFHLLTTFFLQLTNIMVTLSRFIATEPQIYLAQNSNAKSQEQCKFEKKEEKSKLHKSNEQSFKSFEQAEGQGLSKYKYEHVANDSEEEIIKKGKLSGAKIAQIEGRKTAELTDKMDIVISEFQKKSGFEEQSHDQFFRSRNGSRTKMKNEEDRFYETQKQTHTDHRKTYEEFSETKTESLDIREMKSEKHTYESKTTKADKKPYVYQTNITDDKNLTYVAIVEAHVYTNKNAIFEEQMRREREIKSQNLEKTKVETNQEIRKLSLADTIIIPQAVEISVKEVEVQTIQTERGITSIEQPIMKIAARKISEVLEPLVEITTDRIYSVKQAHTTEEPCKSVVQSTNVSTEEFQQYFVATTLLSQKIYPSLEKPTKSVVEITEITADENESQDLDVSKLIIEEPKSIIEDAKPIAETIEITVKEDELLILDESKPQLLKPRQLVESMVKSVAETTEVVTGTNIEVLITPEKFLETSQTVMESAFKATAETITILPEESKSTFVEGTKIKEESAKLLIDEKVASEVFEVSLIEQREESLDEKKLKKAQPTLLLEESTFSVAQKSSISPVEPKSDIEIFAKADQTADIKFDELKAVESTFVNLEEPGNNVFETPEMTEKYPLTKIEDSHLTIAEVFTISPDEPKDESFEVSKILECKSSIDIVEIKAAETIVIRPEEPKCEQLEVVPIEEKIPETAFEGRSLKVAEIISMLPEEPKSEFYVPELTNQHSNKYPLTTIEDAHLTIAEVFTILPDEPKDESFEVSKILECKSSIDIVEIKAAETIVIRPEEPKCEQLEVVPIEEKIPETAFEGRSLKVAEIISMLPEEPKSEFYVPELTNQHSNKYPLTTIEDAHLTIAEVFTILPDEPKDESFEVSKILECQSSIDIVEIKAAETIVIRPEEPKCEQLEVIPIEEKILETAFERPSLKVAEIISMLTEEPKSEFYVPELKNQHSNKYPLTTIEDAHLTIAEVFTILPDEPKDESFEISKIIECKSSIDIVDIKAAETIIIRPEEPKCEQLEVVAIEEKIPETAFEGTSLKVAEIISMLPEEPKGEFYVPELKNQQAAITILEFEAAEATVVESEESQLPELNIVQPKESRPKQIIEPSVLSVAEVLATTIADSSKLIPVAEITKKQLAHIEVEKHKAIETTEVALGDFTYNKLRVLMPETKQLKTSVEESVQSVAQITEVNLTDAEKKLPISLKINTKVKATSAIEAIKTTEIVKSEEVGRSISPTSPLSPITPVVEEYMFSLEAELEHPYVVEETVSEEALLKIKAQKNESIQSAETSFTLAIESIVEADSETVEEIEEVENIHFNKVVHESMYKGYEAKKSNISTITDVNSLPANQTMIIEAGSLDSHNTLSVKNQTIMQDATSIEKAVVEGESLLSQASHKSTSHKSRKLNSSESHYSAVQEKESSAKSIQSGSLAASIKTEASQYAEASNKQLSSTASKSMESTILEGNIELQAHEHYTVSGSYKAASGSHTKELKAASQYATASNQQLSMSASKSMESAILAGNNELEAHEHLHILSGSYKAASGSHTDELKAASQYAAASNRQLSMSASKSMESTKLEGNIGLEAHEHLHTISSSYKEASSSHKKELKAVSASMESKFGAIESLSQLSTEVIQDKAAEKRASLINEKLTLRTDLEHSISNDGQISSPLVPPTPLTDEYIFRLQTELPEESIFIPRDCSISPESIHEDMIVNGLLTNYKTKIEKRIIYSPPLPTPPTSPKETKPVYTKPGLKGGSDRHHLTKEEIHDSRLVSAIDRTLKQIEEYKASVGLTSEEMSYHQEEEGKEFVPIHIVEEWFENEGVHDKAKNSQVEEAGAIKITIVTEESNAGETAVSVTTERNVENNGNDLEIQEISSHFDEITLDGEHDKVLHEEMSSENKVNFKPIHFDSDENIKIRNDFNTLQINSDQNLEEEEYELVAVHPSSLSETSAADESVTINKSEPDVSNVNAQGVQTLTTDMSQELVMLHDQEIIGEEPIIPPVESLKDSEVIKLLNEERTAVEERKWTTFLQKKYSPTPKTQVVYYGDFDVKTQYIPDAYKVKIVKQPKPKIAPDWKAEELKKESSPIIQITEPEAAERTEIQEYKTEQEDNIIEEEKQLIENKIKSEILEELIDKEAEELELEEMAQRNLAEELIKNVENMIDINASTEQQLEQMRDQLAALAQLPSVIQQTVELVNKRINLISQKEQQKKKAEEEHRRQEEQKRAELEKTKQSLEMRVTKTEEELAIIKKEEVKRILEAKIREEKQKKEKMERMKVDQESRQVIQRSTPRVGKPMPVFGPLQERPVILPGGRKWRTPEDVYDEEFISESLVGQAEVIKGSAIGVNFMKFDKPPPALDHLKHSEVFKALHEIEQPLKKVELLGPVLSEADYRERARSMSPCVEKVAESSRREQFHP